MRVRCVANDGNGLLPVSIKAGNTRRTSFEGMRIGEEFTVYGIIIWKGMTSYLINQEQNYGSSVFPQWIPAELFDIIDHQVSQDWYFEFLGCGTNPDFTMICGYKELLDPDHVNDLGVYRKEAMQIFYNRVNEADGMKDEEDDMHET